MKHQARRQWGVMAHSLEMPRLESSLTKPHGSLPTVSPGGPRFATLVVSIYRTMLILLVAAYACMFVGYSLPQSSDAQATLKNLHAGFGFDLMGLFCLRLLVLLLDNGPPMPPPLVEWQARAAKGVQWALCVFMFAMPLVGWLVLNASGKLLVLYGLELPVLVAPHRELAIALRDVHAVGAVLGCVLIGLNIVAWLYQHHTPRGRLSTPGALPNLH